METSPLPLKGYKFWPILGTNGPWVIRVAQANRLYWQSPRTHDTHNFCQTFVSGALTTYFNDLGLSRPGTELRSSACEASALRLSHRAVSHNQHKSSYTTRSNVLILVNHDANIYTYQLNTDKWFDSFLYFKLQISFLLLSGKSIVIGKHWTLRWIGAVSHCKF